MQYKILHTFLSSIMLLIYFFSVTPVHMYGHTLFNLDEVHYSDTEDSQDDNKQEQNSCNYLNGVQLNTGIGFVPCIATLQIIPENRWVELNSVFGYASNQFRLEPKRSFGLRAPPYFT